ncbi:ABC transporter permease [Microvirga tunisiensis]|uniref:ABC transporter permease n=1 Tax=Microvirga tunisiensis TaxID=2108360 RepID=A0A5N7MGZ6_9HYPH|nr:ABC transporter permease [Microvirga tunisiensis]MPR25980.1 ABC transporter permease [Microvirga tunisiensis]
MTHRMSTYWQRWGIFLILLLPIALLMILNPVFRQPGNLFNLWQQASIIGIIAIGQTMVIILGGVDLSVGAVAALSGVVCYLMFGLGGGGLAMVGGVVAALTACAIVGALNGLLITVFNITPLIATLGVLSIVRGLVLIVTNGELVYAEGPAYAFSEFLQDSTLWLPNAGLLFVGLAVAAALVLRRTIFGQYIFAIGGNEKAASLAGLPVLQVKILTYAICSMMAGVGGLLLSSRTASALPNAGISYELQAITAAVIGGAALGGGKGSIFGTVLGILLITAIGNGLNLYNVSPFWQTGVTGLILLLAVGFSTWGNREARSVIR